MKCRAAAAIAFVIGCSGPPASDVEHEVVLRVSAVAGLSELKPGLEVSGSSAAALDLVYDDVVRHVESMRADGSVVVLKRRRSSPYSSQQLAAALRTDDLVSARALDADTIEARFSDEKTAGLVAQYDAAGFDLGPYQVESQDDKHLRLVRRGEGGVDVIEAVPSTRADEWRKLLAHELDVVPLAASLYRQEFAGMASIRVLDIPPIDRAAMYFNVRSPQLADPRVRRRIAASIRREAIARVACGNASCAAPPVTAGEDVPVPGRLSLMCPEVDTHLRIAAKVLRYQLFQIGIDLEIDAVPMAAYVDRLRRGDYALALSPLTRAEHGFGFFLSPGHPKALPMTGFASPEYDAAVDRGDLATAQAILDRELPVTRLFDIRSFAAVDAAFCGDVTPSSSSWLWLSQLHPCEEGEQP